MNKSLTNNVLLWFLTSLTLGMAPIQPEPHLVGKLRWVLGGATDMVILDWLDLLMHLAPWVMLFRAVLIQARINQAAERAGRTI